MLTIKRTRARRYPVLLRSENEDRGPYFLVDLAGFGVSWRNPASEMVPTRATGANASGELATYATHTRHVTWVPTYRRAVLAFALLEADETLSPKLAKEIADKTFERLGNGADTAHAERFALHLLSKAARS